MQPLLTTHASPLTGADILLERLRAHGVMVIFGYGGAAILPIMDRLYDAPDIRYIIARHEQAATHMAAGFARITGQPGIVLVTSGPGATNTLTALANAFADSTPLIVFTGQVATTALGTDAFQEADMTGITRPCTKWNRLITSTDDLAPSIDKAFQIAITGRPGPVLIDLPKDVLADCIYATDGRSNTATQRTRPARP